MALPFLFLNISLIFHKIMCRIDALPIVSLYNQTVTLLFLHSARLPSFAHKRQLDAQLFSLIVRKRLWNNYLTIIRHAFYPLREKECS